MDYLKLIDSREKFFNIIIILAAVIFSYTIYTAQTKSIGSFQQAKELEKEKNEVLTTIIGLSKQAVSYKDYINKKDISSIIQRIGYIASSSGVEINSMKPLEKQDYPVYIRYPFQLSVVSSSYSAVVRFIGNLEKDPDIYIVRAANIKTVAMTKEDGIYAPSISLEFEVNTVLFK